MSDANDTAGMTSAQLRYVKALEKRNVEQQLHAEKLAKRIAALEAAGRDIIPRFQQALGESGWGDDDLEALRRMREAVGDE